MPKLAAWRNREGNLEDMRWRLRPSGEKCDGPSDIYSCSSGG